MKKKYSWYRGFPQAWLGTKTTWQVAKFAVGVHGNGWG